MQGHTQLKNVSKTKSKLFELVSYVIREKRLPARLTENIAFQFPGYFSRRFKHLSRNLKNPKVIVYLTHLQPRYKYQLLHFLSFIYPELFVIWDFNVKNYIKLGVEGRRLFSIKNLKISDKLPDKIQADVLITSINESDMLTKVQAKKYFFVEHDVSAEPNENSFLIPYSVHPFFLERYTEFKRTLPELRNRK